jgi:hypothetical protein
MNSDGPHRAGVLVIRIWMEAEVRPRARIVASLDVLKGPETTVAASSIDEVCEVVREWLTEFVAGERRS